MLVAWSVPSAALVLSREVPCMVSCGILGGHAVQCSLPRPFLSSVASSPAATAAAACAAALIAAVGSVSLRPLRAKRLNSTCPLRTWRPSCSLTRGVSSCPRTVCVCGAQLAWALNSVNCLVKQEGTDTVPRVFVVAAGTVEV